MSRNVPTHDRVLPEVGVPGPARLVVTDVDSTFITTEVIEMLAERAGSRELVAAITERAMRGEIDFTASLRERVATLEGLPESVFADVVAEIELTPGARELVAELQRRRWPFALVSGGFAEVVEPLAASLGIEHVRANRLEVVAGRLTGRLLGPVVDRAGKERALREIAGSLAIPLSRTVAIGDGANDLDMLAAAGLGIAFNAKPLVCSQVEHAVTGRLDAVLDVIDAHPAA